MYRLCLIAGLAGLAAIPGVSVSQNPAHQIAYGYAAVLDSAGNHYVPMGETSYPPIPQAGWPFFKFVEFHFTNKRTGAPSTLSLDSNDPGVSFAGYHPVNGTNTPSAWLIKAELIPSTGVPHQLTASAFGDRYYVAYDTATYVFNEIVLSVPPTAIGGPSMVRRATNYADLPDITVPAGSMRFDFARGSATASVAPTGVKVMPTNPTPVLKPTIPVIKH